MVVISVKAALPPKNEAPRRSGKTVRGTANYLNVSPSTDTTLSQQLQRLNSSFGITGPRAELIASLHWGALPSYNEGMR